MNNTSVKKTFFIAAPLTLVLLGFFLSQQHETPFPSESLNHPQNGLQSLSSDLAHASSKPSWRSNQQAPPALTDSPTHGASAETLSLLEAALQKPVLIEHGGAVCELLLARDELYVRDADGNGRVVSIPSFQDASNLLSEWKRVQKETGSSPELILYTPGAPRNDSTRRIVTRDILIEADSRTAADVIAEASGLGFKSAPVYAQGKYIYEAPSSPEALAFFVKTANSESPYVTPLLGAKMAQRVMPNDPLVQKQWHLKYQNQMGAVFGTDINVEKVWNYPTTSTANSTRGRGVVIGIVDDGLEWTHPDLAPNIRRSLQYDWNGKDKDPKPTSFFYFASNWQSHGTACAGVAAARGNNKIGVSGVAPEAGLAGMRLIDGNPTDLDEAEAMTWKMGEIHILSNSWGPVDNGYTLKEPGSLMASALKHAADFGRNGKGTIITFAGGNGREREDDSNYDGYANSIYTIAVGAVDSLMSQAPYSEPGANIVVSAPSLGAPPSLGIMTTDLKGLYGYNAGFFGSDFAGSGDVTQNFDGTSAACPVVSGVIALMLEKNPNLGWRDVQEILIRTAAQVDANDSDWISGNRTDHVTGNQTVEFHFNHKFGAGLVDAAAAVALSGNWKNLPPQKNLSVTTNSTQSLAASATINRTFLVSGNITRAEHVTLQLAVTDIPKGDLTITLKSPGNTTSTFCIPHRDKFNGFDLNGNKIFFVDEPRENGIYDSGEEYTDSNNNDNYDDGETFIDELSLNGVWDPAEAFTDLNNDGKWGYGEPFVDSNKNKLWDGEETYRYPNILSNWKFMTVRSWAENPNGNWTLTITNNGTITGNLTDATLTVYGTPVSSNSTTLVTVSASTTLAPLSSNITLTATAKAKDGNSTLSGNITGVQFFGTLNGTTTLIGNGTFSGNATNPARYTFIWNTANLTAGNYSITANAISSGNISGTSSPVNVKLDPILVAGWDFQTATQSTVPLATALMSARTYKANFGNGNGTLLFNGSNGSSQWSYANGEIFTGIGTALNAGASFSLSTLNPSALTLRAGKNLAANGKSLTFRCTSTSNKTYTISYAAATTAGGFSKHAWSWSNNATGTYTPIGNATITSNFTTSTFTTSNTTSNGTLFLRLTPSGATSANGMNLIDNIQIQSN